MYGVGVEVSENDVLGEQVNKFVQAHVVGGVHVVGGSQVNRFEQVHVIGSHAHMTCD